MSAVDYFARKITGAKWKGFGPGIGADAVTADLRTHGNALSVWKCSEDSDDLTVIALLFVTQPNVDRLDTLDVFLLGSDDLRSKGLHVINTPQNGRSPVLEWNNRHYDLHSLDPDALVILARTIAQDFREDKRSYRWTAAQLKAMITRALADGIIKESDLHPKLLLKLGSPRT